jgi:glucosamine 6-phosphate synthetase-like amidotransferase/phosphosugar isomerase protein
MCGIAGFNVADGDFGKINSQALARELIKAIEIRGTDATGGAWTQKADKVTEVWYAKQAIRASAWQSYIKEYIPKRSRNVILHTRYATQGDPSDNDNNHPIVVPGIVGVHNGHISNDRELIRDLGVERIGQVDSEAAFQLISQHRDKPQEQLGEIRGRAALAWMRTDRPRELHLARVEGSPLAIGQTKAGTVVFASTMDLLKKACDKAGIKLDWEYHVPEYQYLVFRNGIMDEMDSVVRKHWPSYHRTTPPISKENMALYRLF